MTLAYKRLLIHGRKQNLVDEWEAKTHPARYRDLDLQMRRRKPPELPLPRELLHELLVARSELRNFATYHHRIRHKDTITHCVCGLETSPTHFMRCRRHAGHMHKLRQGLDGGDFHAASSWASRS